MATKCKREGCGYDFEALRCEVDVKTILRERGGVEGDKIRVFCPACAQENRIDLRPYGIFSLNEQLYRWAASATTGLRIEIGRMTLALPAERIKVINTREICYESVPVFRLANGNVSFPRWPVRKEYLDVIDTERPTLPEITNDTYSIQIYFKGLKSPEPYNLNCVAVNPERQPTGDNAAFEGVHLALWPNVPYKAWKRYFLRFGCALEHVRSLQRHSRDINIFALGGAKLGSAERKWIPIDSLASDGLTRYGCIESRPEKVAIEFGTRSGGVWDIDPAKSERYPPGIGTKIAVDFGTSNTCMAIGMDNNQEMLAIKSCDLFIIEGSDLPTRINFADTWPPRQGFGRRKALLPTELLTREKLEDVRINVDRIEQWRPVVDFGIPSSGNQVEFPEDEHIIAEFKWYQRIQDYALRGYARELQRHYIEFTLLFTLAQLARDQRINSQVDVNFSFPLAFDREQREDFAGLLGEVVKSVSAMTGLNVTLNTPLVDEARAAASSLVSHGPACLYVDIGGGSSDIALDIIRTDEREESSIYKYIASFQYAGGALVDAYDGGNCLSVGVNVFRRLVREVGRVKEMFRRGQGFQPRPEKVNRKTALFYGYLMEFLARLLAAHIISEEWTEKLSEDEKMRILKEGYNVELYPLGNGWGFGALLDEEYSRTAFAGDLSDRANKILDEAAHKLDRMNMPRVAVKAPEGFGEGDPKEAVVFGLLKAKMEFRRRVSVNWQYRTIVGYTTKAGTTREVPWYRPVDDRAMLLEGGKTPNGEGELPNAHLTCPPNEWPGFHSKLLSPHELDAGLNRTSNELQTCLLASNKWFHQSPFHVILEKLIKPKLKDIL